MKRTYTVFAALIAAVWLALSGLLWFGGRTDISEAERRKLEQPPVLSWQTVLDGRFMTQFERFTQDQFPFRDGFRRVKAVLSYDGFRRLDNNGIYLADGYAGKLEYPLNERSVETALQQFRQIYEDYLSDGNGKVVFSVVPDKGYYLAAPHGYPALDYERLFEMVQTLPWAQYVDLTADLAADCYYRTDTHWRQETLLPAAEHLAEALGVPLAKDFSPVAVERPFYGVYYGQAALPMEPDRMYYLENEALAACTVTNHETGKAAQVYDLTKLDSRDLYDVFLSGAVSVLTVENPQPLTDRELIVFRDSFGSSMIPLLIPSYAKVTLVDIRYVPSSYLPQFVDFADQDVLFLYSPLVLNHSAMLK